MVCQQFEIDRGEHFRVVTGIDKKFIYLHDPFFENKDKPLAYRHEKFINLLKSNCKNVLGNTCIIITKTGTKLPKVIQKAFKK